MRFARLLIPLLLAFRYRRHLLALGLRLPLPRHRVRVESDLHIPMPDGVMLAADHYAPITDQSVPTILIRSPYGRRKRAGFFGLVMALTARIFAERGYHVLVQDTRGRFDSGGEFNPYFAEIDDGRATLDWIAAQPWSNGVVGTWGPSYLGIVQWVIAADVKAMVPIVTSSDLYEILFPDGAFALSLVMRWLTIFRALDKYQHLPLVASLKMMSDVESECSPAFHVLPLLEADRAALKEQIPYFRLWMEHTTRDELWNDAQQHVRISDVSAPVHLIAGWYDFFLRSGLEDYQSLKAAGRQPYLTIGPWHHFVGMNSLVALRESVAWYDAQLKGDYRGLNRQPVRLYVMGANEWRQMPDFPPPSNETRYYLHTRRLVTEPPSDSPPDRYRYDPANPTPALGGAQFGLMAGAKDNWPLEARPDVLIYTSRPFDRALEVIGYIRLELFVESTLEYTDFFGRLCDVYPDGRSINICDGLFRVESGKGERLADGTLRICVDMWATAYRFRKGHAMRLLVASGAHPLWSRNTGSGEPLATATRLAVADQTVYHDAAHPSALILPVTSVQSR
jgi:putative CocE/NonD family hydrolase